MKKFWNLILLIPLFSLFSCMDDTSAYLAQDKESVSLDGGKNEDADNGEEEFPEGTLVPGVHLVKLKIMQNGQEVERSFKYYMPVSIDATRSIALIFELHGNYVFEPGATTLPKPLDDFMENRPFPQHAIKNNCIICYPLGETEYSPDGSGSIGWQGGEYLNSIPFVKAMIEYFKNSTPTIDPARIYATGQSSGGVFSFVLAFHCSDLFAAVAPRSGQMSLKSQTVFPARAVPIRAFVGEEDTGIANGIITNMTDWAEKIGGYFASDMVYTENALQITGYKKVDTRIWSGGKTDLQIYTLREEGHGIEEYSCMPYIWEFLNAYTLDQDVNNLYISCETRKISLACGFNSSIAINYTEGATVRMDNVPTGWTIELNGKILNITSPTDYYGNVSREGTFTLTASNAGGQSSSLDISYQLEEPKSYLRVGDIYYNHEFKPIGVVCQVDPQNIRKGKIVSLEENTSYFWGSRDIVIDLTIETTEDNGAENTRTLLAANQTLDLPVTSIGESAFVWANGFSVAGETGWYMPSIEELEEINKNISVINKTIGQANLGTAIGTEILCSSTATKNTSNKPAIYVYDYTLSIRSLQSAGKKGSNPYFIAYIRSRAFKAVSK